MQDKLKEKGVKPERLYLVRNWVDLDKIKPIDGPSPYRAELGLSNEHFVALYAGSIGAKQALYIIFEAAERLVSEPNIVFVIAGDGPEKLKLQARYGHLPNVHFLPVQPDERLCELLNLASVHILPQDRGAVDLVLPSKLGGMLASGKPCIVMADQGTELYEFLGDGAILLPPGDGIALANAIAGILHRVGCQALGSKLSNLAALDAKKSLSELKSVLTTFQKHH